MQESHRHWPAGSTAHHQPEQWIHYGEPAGPWKALHQPSHKPANNVSCQFKPSVTGDTAQSVWGAPCLVCGGNVVTLFIITVHVLVGGSSSQSSVPVQLCAALHLQRMLHMFYKTRQPTLVVIADGSLASMPLLLHLIYTVMGDRSHSVHTFCCFSVAASLLLMPSVQYISRHIRLAHPPATRICASWEQNLTHTCAFITSG